MRVKINAEISDNGAGSITAHWGENFFATDIYYNGKSYDLDYGRYPSSNPEGLKWKALPETVQTAIYNAADKMVREYTEEIL
ncbi:MAG: hypothetical protein Q8M94_03750 [Ignavibacteria bacterium]|nr:hypothetical protein [Ignavibacteria bacterium]